MFMYRESNYVGITPTNNVYNPHSGVHAYGTYVTRHGAVFQIGITDVIYLLETSLWLALATTIAIYYYSYRSNCVPGPKTLSIILNVSLTAVCFISAMPQEPACVLPYNTKPTCWGLLKRWSLFEGSRAELTNLLPQRLLIKGPLLGPRKSQASFGISSVRSPVIQHLFTHTYSAKIKKYALPELVLMSWCRKNNLPVRRITPGHAWLSRALHDVRWRQWQESKTANYVRARWFVFLQRKELLADHHVLNLRTVYGRSNKPMTLGSCIPTTDSGHTQKLHLFGRWSEASRNQSWGVLKKSYAVSDLERLLYYYTHGAIYDRLVLLVLSRLVANPQAHHPINYNTLKSCLQGTRSIHNIRDRFFTSIGTVANAPGRSEVANIATWFRPKLEKPNLEVVCAYEPERPGNTYWVIKRALVQLIVRCVRTLKACDNVWVHLHRQPRYYTTRHKFCDVRTCTARTVHLRNNTHRYYMYKGRVRVWRSLARRWTTDKMSGSVIRGKSGHKSQGWLDARTPHTLRSSKQALRGLSGRLTAVGSRYILRDKREYSWWSKYTHPLSKGFRTLGYSRSDKHVVTAAAGAHVFSTKRAVKHLGSVTGQSVPRSWYACVRPRYRTCGDFNFGHGRPLVKKVWHVIPKKNGYYIYLANTRVGIYKMVMYHLHSMLLYKKHALGVYKQGWWLSKATTPGGGELTDRNVLKTINLWSTLRPLTYPDKILGSGETPNRVGAEGLSASWEHYYTRMYAVRQLEGLTAANTTRPRYHLEMGFYNRQRLLLTRKYVGGAKRRLSTTTALSNVVGEHSVGGSFREGRPTDSKYWGDSYRQVMRGLCKVTRADRKVLGGAQLSRVWHKAKGLCDRAIAHDQIEILAESAGGVPKVPLYQGHRLGIVRLNTVMGGCAVGKRMLCGVLGTRPKPKAPCENLYKSFWDVLIREHLACCNQRLGVCKMLPHGELTEVCAERWALTYTSCVIMRTHRWRLEPSRRLLFGDSKHTAKKPRRSGRLLSQAHPLGIKQLPTRYYKVGSGYGGPVHVRSAQTKQQPGAFYGWFLNYSSNDVLQCYHNQRLTCRGSASKKALNYYRNFKIQKGLRLRAYAIRYFAARWAWANIVS